MAFPTTVYLSYGQEKVESSEQKQKLGTRAVTPDGRVFYYAKCSATAITPAGKIVDGIAAVAAHDMDVAAAATSMSRAATAAIPSTIFPAGVIAVALHLA